MPRFLSAGCRGLIVTHWYSGLYPVEISRKAPIPHDAALYRQRGHTHMLQRQRAGGQYDASGAMLRRYVGLLTFGDGYNGNIMEAFAQSVANEAADASQGIRP